MMKNPIFPGFNPDPCICKAGDDYFVIVSSFEWMPALPIYHSKDLKSWELYTHVIRSEEQADIRKLPSAKGIWAPCLTYCEEEKLFYVIYGVMNSMNARYFDVDNYLITASDIKGPWSEPIYLHSAGFDASILHDDNGKKYIVSLEWETREGYEKPGAVCIAEYSPVEKKIIGYPKRFWQGGTDRGCIEAPHLYKRKGFYYIMCAEGGTGYGHSVTMGRSENVWGPYEKDPMNPIVTSIPGEFNERKDPDHLKPKYYNPESMLQKSGHGSYVENELGEVYLVHLTARPFVPELRCTLGRETAMQKMMWTDDGWLRMADQSNLAKESFEESKLPEYPMPQIPDFDDFNSDTLGIQYYAPRISPESFTDVKARPGYVRIRGQESRTSLNKVSILARKLTSVNAVITTKMEFKPEIYQHSAGLILYYDNMNYINLRKYYSQTLGQSAISVIQLENGTRTEYLDTRIPVKDVPLYFRLRIENRKTFFEWSYDGEEYFRIGKEFDTTKFSDEYCKYGEFTGTFVGMTCADRMFHQHYADFDFFEYEDIS
ncbi:glycoside hydrolase family 43 protein [Clostridium sp. WB02_MRS01]|uniref:glycoside hydrolase family 43 protein n=1 Tax=Clostridium sp. WB02_MRS01 TaxID=2605777 RepID=UPI0012B43E79|nr:glycoside hydrolase family 43 protein [Clostridium sp. WB02_MRS01]MSS09678.1 glycoside hydrolase family 43 protein [Clostridium sp. WB02_MRS01]